MKRKRALLESNPPGIVGWVCDELLPEVEFLFRPQSQNNNSEHSPMPTKTQYKNELELSNRTYRFLHFTMNQDTLAIYRIHE
jgi:hypothetical protein